MNDHSNTFEHMFDARRNGLNFVRLLLAAGVIVWHSFPLTGADIAWVPLRQLAADVWVDAFFAVSGFLIVGSWVRDPHVARFMRARLLRIFPGYWVCLLVTAFVITPVMTGVLGWWNVSYVIRNAALWVFQFDIKGTPEGVPYPGVWNGSIWTLAWEFACYILVLLIGWLGLLERRGTLISLFGIFLGASVASMLGVLHSGAVASAARFGIMFVAGSLVWLHRRSIKVTPPWVVSACALTVAALWLPDYRIVAALPVAYLALAAGAAIKSPRLRLRNDISYGVYVYAFPAQQALALLGLWRLGTMQFALLSALATLPFALASWFLVEKTALRFKDRRADERVTNRIQAPL